MHDLVEVELTNYLYSENSNVGVYMFQKNIFVIHCLEKILFEIMM